MTRTALWKRGLMKAWHAATPRFGIVAGARRLRITPAPQAAGIFDWVPDWKTALIGEILGKRGGLFIDVGANIGQTLLDYCAAPRREGYVGFEPNARCVDHLASIIRSNALTDCVVVPAALSSRDGLVKFYSNPDVGVDAAATLIGDIRPSLALTSEIVAAYRFDSVRDEIVAGRGIGLVKIDVEGAELHTLLGMRETLAAARPWLLCEVLNRDGFAEEAAHAQRMRGIMTLLGELDYAVFRIVKSVDRKRVRGYARIAAFPEIIYAPENAESCDYLFLPDDEADALAG